MLNTSIICIKYIEDNKEKNIQLSKIKKDKQYFFLIANTKLNKKKIYILTIYQTNCQTNFKLLDLKKRFFDKITNKILYLNKRNLTNSYFLQKKVEKNIYILLRRDTNNKSNRKNKSNKNLNNIDIAKSAAINSSYSII